MPRARAAGVLRRRDHDRHARLSVRPVVLEDVVLDEHTAGVLELEQVLDRPLALPRRILPDVVPADRDVARGEADNGRIPAAEHDVLTGAREEIVLDEVRPRAIPPLDGLRVESLRVAI